MPTRGFILQATHAIENQHTVVLLHGVLEGGGSFLVRERRHLPGFFIDGAASARATELGATVRARPGWRSLDGTPVARLEAARPVDQARWHERLDAAGVRCHEADLRVAQQYLIERDLQSALAIEGAWRPEAGITRVYEDPTSSPAQWTPRLSVLSLDIETDPAARELLSVGLHGCGASEVLLRTAPEQSCPAGALACADERALIEALCARVRALDPDVLTGWNVVDFDLSVLERRARELHVPLELGRGPGPMRLFAGSQQQGSGERALRVARVPGRAVLDGLRLLRASFVNLESYALDAAARALLGEGKTLAGTHRADEILRLFHEDRAAFIEYNRTDARLVIEILEKLQLVELAVERSLLTGLPPDRVAASVAAFEFLYLSALHRRRIVGPSLGPVAVGAPTVGGEVLEPVAGLHRNVLVFDFRSLYPSIIRTFQIDPLGLVRVPGTLGAGTAPACPSTDGPDLDCIRAPNGAAFRRDAGVLPEILAKLFPRRQAAQEAGQKVAAQAIKILMNSFYGVLGTPTCRFFDPQLANAITSFGRALLHWCRDRCEALGFRVLYGDTDSVFVEAGCADRATAQAAGERLHAQLNHDLAAHVASTWGVPSHLELRLERLYDQLHLPTMRGGDTGARKRYVGWVETEHGGEVIFTGMEAVRRDWTALAHEVQRGLYERLFRQEPVTDYLRDVIRTVRAGARDTQLTYRKALRKPLSAYTATTPPHVAAARKLAGPPPRIIEYVMTRDGPEPVASRRHPIDHEHYIERQLRPIAEPLLELLGVSFEACAGGHQQLEMF